MFKKLFKFNTEELVQVLIVIINEKYLYKIHNKEKGLNNLKRNILYIIYFLFARTYTRILHSFLIFFEK